MYYFTDSNVALEKIRWYYQSIYKVLCQDFIFDNQAYSTYNKYSKCKNVTLPVVKTFDNKAISVDYWKLIEKFNSKLDKLEYFAYNICNKIVFDIGIKKVDDINECK